MANRTEIMKKIQEYKNSGQDIIRREYLKELSEYTGNDTIIYFSSFKSGGINIDNSDIQGFMTCNNGLSNETLDLIIHSPGGSSEAAEQIVQYLRSKYKKIRAIIPQNAMSAATMIACACDEIILGRESAIGPIDPQMVIPNKITGTVVLPAHSILEDFKKAKDEIVKNPQVAPLWISRLQSIPAGYLDLCEKTISLSKEKVEEWLNNYMFKDCQVKKGKEIAEWLGNFKEHKTHGRPINYELAKEKGLIVKRLEDDQELQDKVLSVYHSTLVTFDVTDCVKIIENQIGKGSYVIAKKIINNKIQ